MVYTISLTVHTRTRSESLPFAFERGRKNWKIKRNESVAYESDPRILALAAISLNRRVEKTKRNEYETQESVSETFL